MPSTIFEGTHDNPTLLDLIREMVQSPYIVDFKEPHIVALAANTTKLIREGNTTEDSIYEEYIQNQIDDVVYYLVVKKGSAAPVVSAANNHGMIQYGQQLDCRCMKDKDIYMISATAGNVCHTTAMRGK
jgi:hypothetical protein